MLSSRAWSLVHPSPPGNEKHKLQVCLSIYAEHCISGAPGTQRPLKPCTPQNGCQMCWLYWIPRSLTPEMLRLLPVWFLLCSSFSLPGTVLQDRVWPWVAAVPAEAFCWHTGVLGARLTGTLFKHRKHVCFYSSSSGAWAGILCHFLVLGARFSRKTASPFAAKHTSYWPANLHLALSGLPLPESSYSLTWIWFDICRCNKQYRDSWSEHSLAAHARVASWAGLLSSLLVWLHCGLVTL